MPIFHLKLRFKWKNSYYDGFIRDCQNLQMILSISWRNRSILTKKYTGLHQERVYTFSGISSVPNAYTNSLVVCSWITNLVFGMFLTSELVYGLWEEVPELACYRLICKPVVLVAIGTHNYDAMDCVLCVVILCFLTFNCHCQFCQ